MTTRCTFSFKNDTQKIEFSAYFLFVCVFFIFFTHFFPFVLRCPSTPFGSQLVSLSFPPTLFSAFYDQALLLPMLWSQCAHRQWHESFLTLQAFILFFILFLLFFLYMCLSISIIIKGLAFFDRKECISPVAL